MSNIKKAKGNIYLKDTSVSNIFINEIMPTSPGNYVKVYLYILMKEALDEELDCEEIYKTLGMGESEVNRALTFFEEKGILTRTGDEIEIVDLRETLFSNGSKVKERNEGRSAAEANEEIRALLKFAEANLGKTLSTNDLTEISSWVTDIHAPSCVIKRAITYCIEKNKFNINYISKVVIQWTKNGLETDEDIDNYLEEIGARNSLYKKVLTSLGMNRQATQAEKEMIDSWTDEMKFSEFKILKACDTTISTSNPSLRYVNKVLENWKAEADKVGKDVNSDLTIKVNDLKQYYEHLRKEAEEASISRLNEVYEKIPRIKQIDEESKSVLGAISLAVLKKMPKDELDELRKKAEKLETERAYLLTENNFEVNYTEIKYSCKLCSDTGVDNEGKRCTCIDRKIGEAEIWQRNQLIKAKN